MPLISRENGLATGFLQPTSPRKTTGTKSAELGTLHLMTEQKLMERQKRYDVVGDVHGCLDALQRLMAALGYDEAARHPQGRTLVFVGDLINRGPDSAGVLRLVSRLAREGRARMALGNHDDTLLRCLRGAPMDLSRRGLDATLAQIKAAPDSRTLRAETLTLLENARLYLSLDSGKLIVVHAGIEEAMIGKPIDAETRRFLLNGDATGKSPEGKTLRRDWAASYQGSAFVVYGHTPQERAVVRGRTVNVDTGAYRGGLLSAFRWPECTLVSVPSGFEAKE